MSVLIDSGETIDVGDVHHPFFRPIDAIWGNYKDHNNVLDQFLANEADTFDIFSLEHSEVCNTETEIFGIALSITKKGFAKNGDLITSYKVKKEIIKSVFGN